MHKRITFRLRVTLLATAMGLVLSVLFAYVAAYIAEDYEHVLVDGVLLGQAEDYTERLKTQPDTILPRTQHIKGYLRRVDGSGYVPASLAALGPGIHESELDSEEGLHWGVFDTAVGRLYFQVDLQRIEALESHLNAILAGIVTFGTLLSAWLGWLLSRGAIVPLQRLADAVDALPVQPSATALAQGMPHDEVRRLAEAIDRYQARLSEADAAERSFFADASHELRTPVAIVRGATELLIDDVAALPSLQPLVARIDRGIRDLSSLLDALLQLARRQREEACDAVELKPWLHMILQRLIASAPAAVRLELIGDDAIKVLPRMSAEVVITTLARRLLSSRDTGTLQVESSMEQITIDFIADHAASSLGAPTHASRGDRMLATTLVGRLARSHGWTIMQSDDAPHRVTLRWSALE